MKRYINKETGEKKAFGNLQVYAEAENTNERQFLGNFDSFKQILEYYEDYIPKEPLIKDDKIRKAVRAWAEANGDTKVYYNRPTTEICINDKVGYAIRSIKFKAEFRAAIDIKSGYYTITELCGEEEE